MLKRLILSAKDKAPVLTAIDPAHGQTIGSEDEPEHFEGMIMLPKQLSGPLVRAGSLTAHPTTLVDDDNEHSSRNRSKLAARDCALAKVALT